MNYYCKDRETHFVPDKDQKKANNDNNTSRSEQTKTSQMSYADTESYNSTLSSLIGDARTLDGASPNVPESPTFTVTDLLSSLDESSQEPDYLVTKGNNLVLLLQKHPYIKNDLVFNAFGDTLRKLLTHPKKEVVATGYRICRYVIHNQASIHALLALGVEVLVIISLSKSFTHDIERVNALKLVRSFIDVPGGVVGITKGIVSALIAVTEQIDDRLRNIAIETICELSLVTSDLVSPQILIQFIVEGPHELTLVVATVFLKLANEPEGRSKIQVADILRLISPFTEFPVKGRLNSEKLQVSSLVISKFLKNFTGLYSFSLNAFEPLKGLLACLTYPINGVVSKTLDLLLDVLLISPLSKKSNSSNQILLVPYKAENEFILHTQYLTFLLMILLKCNVVDGLLYVLKKSSDEGNSTKAAFLLAEIFNGSVNLIPEELTFDFTDRIPKLVGEDVPNFDESKKAIFMVEKLTRRSYKGRLNLSSQGLKVTDNFVEACKNYRRKADYFVDDARLKQLIQDSKVLSTKNFSKWNCDVISELFRGPFMNGKKLEEVNRTSKFLKRLLSFYRPFKRKFSNTKKTKYSQRFSKVGCEIIESLISSTEGRKLLKESKILPQIAECLAQLDPFSGFYAKEQIFSEERLQTTLSEGYIQMIGVLSKKEYGLQLLENWKIFTILHHIADSSKRLDVLLLFLNELRFNKQGHSRILLSKFLHSSNEELQRHATNKLRSLIYEEGCTSFVCELLLEQLYEQHQELTEEVVKILYDYCSESSEHLNEIVELAPSIPLLMLSGESGESLVLKFLSTSQGFEYLNEQGLIQDEFKRWTDGLRFLEYAVLIEDLLLRLDRENEKDTTKRKQLPSNFFGELVKTEEGFNFVVRSGIMTEFINTLRQYTSNFNSSDIDLLRVKGSLWSIGFISTSQLGIEALDVNGTIEDVMKIAQESPLFDLRGVAFYVLGLISKTFEGIEILDEYGWASKLDVYNKPIGVISPTEIYKLIGSEQKHTHKNLLEDISFLDEIDPNDRVLMKLMRLIGSLCNTTSLNSATKELTSLSNSYPEYFENPDVFFVVLDYLETFRYRYTIRKHIIELFVGNKRLLDLLVTGEKRRPNK